VLSSNGRQGFAEKFLNEGADDYLVKPINNSVMVASINRLARRARAEQEANRANGDH
jgi:DNA-binding response OmpR family regulator